MISKQNETEALNLLKPQLGVILKGNRDAVNYCLEMYRIIQVWDDLVDGDVPAGEQSIDSAFMASLVTIPSNPFFQQYSVYLIPTVLNCILQWQDSNKLEKSGTDHDLHMAFVLRASYFQLVSMCAYIVGGPEWANGIGPSIRKLYSETLDDYMKEAKQCLISEPQ